MRDTKDVRIKGIKVAVFCCAQLVVAGLLFSGCCTTPILPSRSTLPFRYEILLSMVLPRDGTPRGDIEATFGRPLGYTLRTPRGESTFPNDLVFEIYPEGLFVHFDRDGKSRWAHFWWREKLGFIGLETSSERTKWTVDELRWICSRLSVAQRNLENGFYRDRGNPPPHPDTSRWTPMLSPAANAGWSPLNTNEMKQAYELARWYATVGVRVPETTLHKLAFAATYAPDNGRQFVFAQFYDPKHLSPDPTTGIVPVVIGGPPYYIFICIGPSTWQVKQSMSTVICEYGVME